MAVEIERKFLVVGTDWRVGEGTPHAQGYLNRDPARTVRVRIAGGQAFLTVKGIATGATRQEFEYPIPPPDAAQLLLLSDGPVVHKLRRVVHHQGFDWEVDEFLGDNAPLVLAEIELASETQAFARPGWLGAEVTGDARYFNSSLAAQPYGRWRA